MKDLMQLIESKQFMAHANSILEAESNTTTNAGDKVCNMLNFICKFEAEGKYIHPRYYKHLKNAAL